MCRAADGAAWASAGLETRPVAVAMRPLYRDALARHSAGPGAGGTAEPDGASDLRELTGVIVPVVVEHRAGVHPHRDLVGPHELFEQRDSRLAAEVPLLEPLDVGEQPPALGVERLSELRER